MAIAEKRRVVIIEDDADCASMLAELLQLRGHDVAVALDASHGLGAVDATHPDVVLCDVGLPDLDGIRLGKMLRARVGPGTTLVAVTGFTSADDERRTREAGFDYHLPKPMDVGTLDSILARAR
jgi:DNA-binding response OmpR family regulator